MGHILMTLHVPSPRYSAAKMGSAISYRVEVSGHQPLPFSPGNLSLHSGLCSMAIWITWSSEQVAISICFSSGAHAVAERGGNARMIRNNNIAVLVFTLYFAFARFTVFIYVLLKSFQFPLTTWFLSVPIFSIFTSTRSPWSIRPMPAIVPVAITSPGRSVITFVIKCTR
jgi:hypothetical protein